MTIDKALTGHKLYTVLSTGARLNNIKKHKDCALVDNKHITATSFLKSRL